MIIDFHTHTFPDAIAEKTIAYLTEKGGIKPYREGTLSSLIENKIARLTLVYRASPPHSATKKRR